MSCGDKYSALLVTSGSGYTPENTYGLFATPWDYAEWREVAFRLGLKAEAHLKKLQATEKTFEQTVEANAIVDRYNLLVERIDALPGLLGGTWSGVKLEESIGLAVSVSVDATCIMEEIDDQLEAAGVEPPKEPEGRKPKTKPLDLSGLGNVAILAGAVFVGWRIYEGSK